MEVIDDIYLEEQSEVWAHLDDIEDDIKAWCDRKEEPPDYVLSILDKINKYKENKERKAKRAQEIEMSKGLTPIESY